MSYSDESDERLKIKDLKVEVRRDAEEFRRENRVKNKDERIKKNFGEFCSENVGKQKGNYKLIYYFVKLVKLVKLV